MLRDTLEKVYIRRKKEEREEYLRGKLEGKFESAKIMIQDFNLPIEEVSKKLNITIKSLLFLKK